MKDPLIKTTVLFFTATRIQGLRVFAYIRVLGKVGEVMEEVVREEV